MLQNFILFTAGVSGVTAAIELSGSHNYIGAIIAGIIGLVAIYLYEKLPPSA